MWNLENKTNKQWKQAYGYREHFDDCQIEEEEKEKKKKNYE